jgi:hypothetical protein
MGQQGLTRKKDLRFLIPSTLVDDAPQSHRQVVTDETLHDQEDPSRRVVATPRRVRRGHIVGDSRNV